MFFIQNVHNEKRFVIFFHQLSKGTFPNPRIFPHQIITLLQILSNGSDRGKGLQSLPFFFSPPLTHAKIILHINFDKNLLLLHRQRNQFSFSPCSGSSEKCFHDLFSCINCTSRRRNKIILLKKLTAEKIFGEKSIEENIEVLRNQKTKGFNYRREILLHFATAKSHELKISKTS